MLHILPNKLPDDAGLNGRSLVGFGASLGLLYGCLEAVEVIVVGAIPGILAWRTGNSAHVLWFAPLFYAVVGAVVAIPFAVLTRFLRRPLDAALVFVVAWAGAFLGVSLAEGVIAFWSIVVLALGIAVVVTRLYRAYRPVVLRLQGRATVALGLAVLLALVAVPGGQILRERWTMARLPDATGKPNVLFIVLDTQRADHLSAYGYSRATTPNLDAFAADAVLYENAFAPSSWTLPSHASFFTGRTPQEHRAGVLRRPFLGRAFPTVAEVFRAAGYVTGGFVANGYWCGRQTGLDRGFIRYEDFYGTVGDAVARTALGRLATYHWLPRLGLVDIPGRKRADRINTDFLDWVSQRDGRPFMAFLNYFDVHGPLLPPAPYQGRFAGKPVDRGNSVDIGVLTGDIPELGPEAIQEVIDRYDESLLFLDAEIGRLISSLRNLALLENTVVIITSDHGESFGEHGMRLHGHSMFREQLHVPLMIRTPGGSHRARVSTPVGAERVAATMLTLAGVENRGIAGTPLPLSDSAAPQLPIIGGVARRSMTAANWPSSRGWVTSVVTESWHFLLREDGTVRVYGLGDRDEGRDLAALPSMADSVTRWKVAYGQLWKPDTATPPR